VLGEKPRLGAAGWEGEKGAQIEATRSSRNVVDKKMEGEEQ
jgi:hypothetical protein